MSTRELNFSKENLTFAFSEVKEMFAMHLEEGCRQMVRKALGRVMECDLTEHLQASYNQRTETRLGYRNGYRQRSLLTGFGEVRLRVPRDREGDYEPPYFKRYKRISPKVEEGIKAMYLRGVSTAKVGEVLETLCGTGVSAGHVSSVCKALNQKVREFESAPIDDDIAFLFLDGLHVKVLCDLHVKKRILLFAYGIKSNGQRLFLGFRLVKSESRANYLSFLESLKARGLKGNMLKCITMDGGLGLWAAIEEVYPEHPDRRHELCWAHKLRNVASRCPKRYHDELLKGARAIMNAKSQGIAIKLFKRWKDKWQKLVPRAVKCLEDDFDKLTPCFDFPREMRKIIRTTNVIERCFREVRRRLKVMGHFKDSGSCRRIVVSLVEYFNYKWAKNSKRIKLVAEYYRNAA